MNVPLRLMQQISIIQQTLKNYHIKECLIFGSMLKGNNNLFSDFDIAVEATNIMKIVEKNKDYLVSEGNNIENFTRTILDEAGSALAYKLNVDISIDVNFNDENYFNLDIYEPHIRILKNGRKVRKDILEKQILKIRSTVKNNVITTKEYWGKKQQSYYLWQQVERYSARARYFSFITSKENFLNPNTIEEETMRNDIINGISHLSSIVNKVDENIINDTKLPFFLLKRLNEISKEKQLNKQNFNTLALGWQVCCEEDLSTEEFNLFEDFYFETQKFILGFILNAKQEGQQGLHYQAFRLYNQSIKDKEGFLEHTRSKYYIKKLIDENDLYVRILNQLIK